MFYLLLFSVESFFNLLPCNVSLDSASFGLQPQMTCLSIQWPQYIFINSCCEHIMANNLMDVSFLISDFLFKFLVIGSAGTGKSCILHQFIENKCKYTMIYFIAQLGM